MFDWIKFAATSKTVIGILVAAAPTILPIVGVSFSIEDGQFINANVDNILTGIGSVLGIYGRFVASGPAPAISAE